TQALVEAMAASPILRTETRGQVRNTGDWRLRPQGSDGQCSIETQATAIAGRALDPAGARVVIEARSGVSALFTRIVDFDPAAGPAVVVGRQRFPLPITAGSQWLLQPMLAGKADGAFNSETRLFRALAGAQEFSVAGTSRWGGPLSISFSARGFADALRQLDGCAQGDLRWMLKPTTPDSGPVPLTQPAANAPRPAADLAQGVGLSAGQRLQVLRALHGLGFQAEGFADPWRLLRPQAIADYQKSRRAEPTGRLSLAEANALMATAQARQPTAWEAEGANPLMRLSLSHELLWGTDWPAVVQVRAYALSLGLARDCSWRDCLGLIQQHFSLRQTRMLDDATFRAMGAAPRTAEPDGAERFGDWRFTPARPGGECVLAAAPRRIEGPSYWTQSRIEFRRNPDVGRTVLVQRLAGFVDFSPDEPPVLEAGQVRIPLEPAWGSPWFRGESTGLSGDGWTQSNAALRALAAGGEVAIAGRSRWGGALRLVYAADGFAAAFARLDEACGGGALAAAYINAPGRGRGR
ncbi:MAG: hypothetical protein KIS72_12365, partial [Luteimonas sp.]|nr:hypothetical protein [Luteimonas sp.]